MHARSAPSIALGAIGKPDPADGGGHPGPGPERRVRDNRPEAASEKVIVTAAAAAKALACAPLLSKLLGKDKREKLGATQIGGVDRCTDRAWSGSSQVQGARGEGHAVARRLEPHSGRQQGPLAMTPAQEAMMKKAKGHARNRRRRRDEGGGSRGGGVCADRGSETKKPQAVQGPRKRLGRIVIPLNDKQHVTVERLKAVTTEKGTTWRGKV